MKRFILPSVFLTILLLTLTSSLALAKDGEGHKGGNSGKGRNEHRQGGSGHHRGGGHGKHHGHHGHRHRPSWGFGLWAPPMYPYGGGYYHPYHRPMPPRPYMRPYGGYYRNGDFGFFFNF